MGRRRPWRGEAGARLGEGFWGAGVVSRHTQRGPARAGRQGKEPSDLPRSRCRPGVGRSGWVGIAGAEAGAARSVAGSVGRAGRQEQAVLFDLQRASRRGSAPAARQRRRVGCGGGRGEASRSPQDKGTMRRSGQSACRARGRQAAGAGRGEGAETGRGARAVGRVGVRAAAGASKRRVAGRGRVCSRGRRRVGRRRGRDAGTGRAGREACSCSRGRGPEAGNGAWDLMRS